jgi:hypothetical protein
VRYRSALIRVYAYHCVYIVFMLIYVHVTRQGLRQYTTSDATSVRTKWSTGTATVPITATVSAAPSAAAAVECDDYLSDDSHATGAARTVDSESSNSSSSDNKRNNVLGSDLIVDIVIQHCEDQHSSTHTPVTTAAAATATAAAAISKHSIDTQRVQSSCRSTNNSNYSASGTILAEVTQSVTNTVKVNSYTYYYYVYATMHDLLSLLVCHFVQWYYHVTRHCAY